MLASCAREVGSVGPILFSTCPNVFLLTNKHCKIVAGPCDFHFFMCYPLRICFSCRNSTGQSYWRPPFLSFDQIWCCTVCRQIHISQMPCFCYQKPITIIRFLSCWSHKCTKREHFIKNQLAQRPDWPNCTSEVTAATLQNSPQRTETHRNGNAFQIVDSSESNWTALKWCENSGWSHKCRVELTWVRVSQIYWRTLVLLKCHMFCLHDASAHLKSTRTSASHGSTVPPHVNPAVQPSSRQLCGCQLRWTCANS